MEYVYLLESIPHPSKRYVGVSTDFQRRLKQHNAGRSAHTSGLRPWRPVVVIRFDDDTRAERFEQYLKSASGHAFAKRHFW